MPKRENFATDLELGEFEKIVLTSQRVIRRLKEEEGEEEEEEKKNMRKAIHHDAMA